MEKLSTRKEAVLEILDQQIEELETKLRKVQPLLDELNSLKRTRATLLDERRVTGGGGRANAQVTMEQIIHDLRTNGPSTPPDIAGRLGVSDSVIRSHLNRHADVRYRKNGDGDWHLIGEEEEDDDG